MAIHVCAAKDGDVGDAASDVASEEDGGLLNGAIITVELQQSGSTNELTAGRSQAGGKGLSFYQDTTLDHPPLKSSLACSLPPPSP